MSHASWTFPPWSLSRERHVEQLQSESCWGGKKFSSHIAHMPTVCCAASALLAPFSNRHLLDPVRSRFRSLIKALEQTQHGTANVQARKKHLCFVCQSCPWSPCWCLYRLVPYTSRAVCKTQTKQVSFCWQLKLRCREEQLPGVLVRQKCEREEGRWMREVGLLAWATDLVQFHLLFMHMLSSK